MSQGTVRCSCAGRTREELQAVENRTVVIRKLLRQLRARLPRGVTGDAERLARVIECLARRGQRCSAADAVEIASRLDAFASMLGREVDNFFAL